MNKSCSTVSIGETSVKIGRGEGGVVEIYAEDELANQKAIGYAHAQDRLMQMFLTRLLGEGRLSEILYDTDEIFALDVLARKMNFLGDATADVANLTSEARMHLEAYCEGVNTYLERKGPPILGRFLKSLSRPWRLLDVLLIVKVHIYFGMSQLQERVERFIFQAIHDGVSPSGMRRLFYPYLSGLDDHLVSLIKQVHIERPYLDIAFSFSAAMSNNWALSGKKTASGAPYFCFDPHLQVNRLPSMWVELICHLPEDDRIGISTPGIPGLIMGKNRHLSASFTYGMMDVVDFFIEQCQDNQVRRGDSFEPLQKRKETVIRKKKGRVDIWFYETDCAVIERENFWEENLEEGLYLSLAWSTAKAGASPALNALPKLWQADSVEKAQEIVRDISMSCNWVFADSKGNIGYQQSGRLPKRNLHSGLYPLPAWEKGSLWQGFVKGEELKSELNPEEGFVASANNDQNESNKPPTITFPFSTYRYRRICSFLSEKNSYTLEEMKKLQCDLYSWQAKEFMPLIIPFIPDTEVGSLLKSWDYHYDEHSKGATLFEAVYYQLLKQVFEPMFGKEAWYEITHSHSLLVYTHGQFDTILLKGEESWFGEGGKESCYRRAIETALSSFHVDTLPTWGENHQFLMKNLLFNGKLPRWLKLDVGPLVLQGNRATLSAGHLFHEGKRMIVAAPSYRFVGDLLSSHVHTVLAGGPSERPLSPYYTSDISLWLQFGYKTIITEYSRFDLK
ncbi:MAG: penicillin acylase family protein [Chlamydiales bacterium]